ncbi:MAG TPA: tRNA (N(6)-L-threonylcarbamoyladenosine(37)-C(2))-methylthiotransferase MtaB, partial [Ruminococcaceae bacterium]|nr:tRNA (N(6)-L-threonylcarbamoyladenosine(37)-C(2))-methylthiotransferase MtaB [Oscillospiraceae bacterium]
GCTATLKRMNRHYTAEDVEQAVKKIRKVFSNNCGIPIDVITGFSGETEKEFDESLTFVRNMAFSQAHVFPYSRRENTRAASMSQQLSNAEKEKRAHQMIAACTQTQQDFRKRFLKKCIPVLFERQADTGEWEGFSPQYFPVRVISNQNLHGQIKNVWITEVDKAACLGHLEHSL